MNWESLLAGIKEPPPDHQLQVMFYEQIRHVPAISNDIAMYDRAEMGSTERSYQFLVAAVRRVAFEGPCLQSELVDTEMVSVESACFCVEPEPDEGAAIVGSPTLSCTHPELAESEAAD